MPVEVPHNVETVEMQKLAIGNIGSLDSYLSFTAKHSANSFWPKDVSDWVGAKNLDPEFFRFLGLIGIICSQYGFPSIDGQTVRHNFKKWEKSPVDPRHQLALGIYTARIGVQAIPLKEELAKRLSDTPQTAYGVWGFFFRAEGGRIAAIDPKYITFTRREAEYRLSASRMITLPDKRLNAQFAAIEFTGDDADRMPDAEFETSILPRVQEAASGWMDPIPVFVSGDSQ